MTNERTSNLKIQGNLPIRTIGIEAQRERKNYSDLPPQNYLHVWFARRPTPAARFGVLTSVLPDSVDDDTLLRWIGINPSNKPDDEDISQFVRRKHQTEDDRDGFIYEHYGYRKPYKSIPSRSELDKIHKIAEDTWGNTPTILDATAGGGAIPFESSRYEFPTIANELNPVPSVILKAVLQHPRINGDLSEEIQKIGEEINKNVRERLRKFFPSSDTERPLEYLWAHTIVCPDCGLNLPLAPNWWIQKESASKGIAAKPNVEDETDSISYELVNLPEDTTKDDFDPSSGTVSYGKATCLRCDVTIESEDVRQQGRDDNIGTQLYALRVEDLQTDNRKFRIPTEEDLEAINKATEKVSNDIDLSTFLSEEIPEGFNTNQPRRYGLTEWRDMYSTRQLLVHYTYLDEYQKKKAEIESEYDSEVSEVILTYLAFAADKALDYNNRLSSWDPSRPKVRNTFERQDFAFKWTFAESNLTVSGFGYEWVLENVVSAYSDLFELSGDSEVETRVLQGDAANLSISDGSVEAVVIDPPYYDNVMYSELSDFFYVWLKNYLGDVFPKFFTTELTQKSEEAVANPERFSDVSGGDKSKQKLAEEEYERKMAKIFKEQNRVLRDDGVITVMFTHKKTEAWDTLTKSLIDAGFVINATHPISTEAAQRVGQARKNSADSTILLSGQKRDTDSQDYTLWSDIQKRTRQVAQDRARSLDQGPIDFTKVDIILASFGPTLEVFTKQYPVVDDEGKEVTPQTALDEARDAVRDYLIEKYLNEGIQNVDPKTEWYVLAWLVFEAERFPYDEARRLAIGVGEELDGLKKEHRLWRKRSGDVLLRPHEDRVQDANKDEKNRSGRKPVDPDALSFSTTLDKVHAAIHIYDVKGSTEAWNWMNDRNCGSDPAFKATLEALLRVLPHEYNDWKLCRDLAAGETGELLELDLSSDIFDKTEEENGSHQGNLGDF